MLKMPPNADLATGYGLEAIDITLEGVMNRSRNWIYNLTD